MGEEEFYDRICNKRFTGLDGKLDQILLILKGDGIDKLGLCERFRAVEKSHRRVQKIAIWGLSLLGGAWLLSNAPVIFKELGHLIGGQ